MKCAQMYNVVIYIWRCVVIADCLIVILTGSVKQRLLTFMYHGCLRVFQYLSYPLLSIDRILF